MKKGNIYINNGSKAKVICENDLTNWEKEGWIKGNLKAGTSYGKIWVYNAIIDDQKMIDPIDADTYIQKGYVLNTKRPHKEETKLKLSEYRGEKASMFGKHMSEEARKRQSEARKGKPGHLWTEDQYQKFTLSMTGHETKLETRKKISEALVGKPKSEEHKQHLKEADRKWISPNRGKQLSEQHKENLSKSHKTEDYRITWENSIINKYGSVENFYIHNKEVTDYEAVVEKGWKSKLKNKTTNTSSQEDALYNLLIAIYGIDQVKRNYKDPDRYPFHCDFYIIPEDKFIELNLFFTHGMHPFDETNPADIEQLSLWKEKAKTSNFYKSAIKVWTELDKLKIETAIANNLNYEVIYNNDFKRIKENLVYQLSKAV